MVTVIHRRREGDAGGLAAATREVVGHEDGAATFWLGASMPGI
jgi:hypothetical protein